jgi:uncharacterized protein YndB with AHSA1/START domain
MGACGGADDANAGSVAGAGAEVARTAAVAVVGATPVGVGFTAVLTVAATPAQVFRELADIENLPRWAGGFCERVTLARGRWVGLTSLGEMFLALEADERAGAITLAAGWCERELHELRLVVAAVGTDEVGVVLGSDVASAAVRGTRVTFTARPVTGEDHARLCRALANEWSGLVARLGGGVRGEAGR